MSLTETMLTVPQSLKKYMKSIPKAAIAFSGGVDSSYLLYATKMCNVNVHCYFVKSQFQPQFELDDAQRLTRELENGMTIIQMDALANDMVSKNSSDRCYHCKQMVFKSIINVASADGYTVVMDGSNASDDPEDRPGMRALTKLKILSPLRETGMTKKMVREYSRNANLFTWNKPSYACLATRVPVGTSLTADMLYKIEKAEEMLGELGFTDFRARIIGTGAKLQLPASQISMAAKRSNELVQALSPWFNDIMLDLNPRQSN